MATITVEPTESGILVSEAGTNDAEVGLEPLPPLTAARYLFVASESAESLRETETSLVENIRPHAHSTLVALEAGFGKAANSEEEPPAKRLAAALGVTVIAPEGRFLSCDGALFAVGADSRWVSYGPLGAKVVHGKRYPEPEWQAQLPSKIEGTVQIPAGVWVTDGADASHAVHLADIAVNPQQLLIVVGSPGEPEPGYTQLLTMLRALPDRTRASAVLIGYDEASLTNNTLRRLAADLQEPLRVAHGATISGKFVRLDRVRASPTGTFAKESICTPDGAIQLDRWSAPIGLSTVTRNTYRLSDDWFVDVVPAGLSVRPAHLPSDGATESHPVIAETLTVMLSADGTSNPKRVIAPLRMLLGRLRDFAPTKLVPVDNTARRLIRNAFPGVWAPTARLAVTEDGRIIAASVDEFELPSVEEEGVETRDDAELTGEQRAEREDEILQVASVPSLPLVPADIGAKAHDRESAPERQPVALVTEVPRAGSRRAAASSVVATGATGHPDPVAPVASVPSAATDPAGTADAVMTIDDKPPAPASVRGTRSRQEPHTRPGSELDPTISTATAATPTVASGATALPPSPSPDAVSSQDPSDALARALRGSAATADLLASRTTRNSGFDATNAITGAAGRGSAEVTLQDEDAPGSRPVANPLRSENAQPQEPAEVQIDGVERERENENDPITEEEIAAPTDVETEIAEAAVLTDRAPAEEVAIEVPRGARSTAEQRHRVRSALGARYDVASRSVSQLLAQQPGMRVSSGDRATLLTTLSVVSVFADDPTARYDLDFHTCLAEGLAALPTTRSIVVRGLPEESTATTSSVLSSGTPFISAPVDAPLTGPVEALIWTTSGRRLDRLMNGSDSAADVILPAHTQLRVLGTAEGTVRRLLLAEEGVNDDAVLTRLHDAAASRDNDATAQRDSRWLGDLIAVE